MGLGAVQRRGRGGGGTAWWCGRIAAARIEREVERCILRFGLFLCDYFSRRSSNERDNMKIVNRGRDLRHVYR